MKQRVFLSKTVSFHTLFMQKKDPNGALLNGIVGLLLPLDVQGRGRRRFFFPLFSLTFFL
jgi:hypothetical protein